MNVALLLTMEFVQKLTEGTVQMELLIQAAGSWEVLGDSDMIFGIIARVVFVICAVLAVWKLLGQVLSAPTYEERHFWSHKRRPR